MQVNLYNAFFKFPSLDKKKIEQSYKITLMQIFHTVFWLRFQHSKSGKVDYISNTIVNIYYKVNK